MELALRSGILSKLEMKAESSRHRGQARLLVLAPEALGNDAAVAVVGGGAGCQNLAIDADKDSCPG